MPTFVLLGMSLLFLLPVLGFGDLWLNALVLTLMGCATVLLAARLFANQRGR